MKRHEVKINDKRVSDTSEREVFTYSEDEKEKLKIMGKSLSLNRF
ncbi:hypothetical protein ACV3RY_13365 [Clostridium perfringens]